ncbi:MAG: DnaD domain protein [Clostridiales bacterium]|nr:DnaD domain protein [Clostridiales bacterium]
MFKLSAEASLDGAITVENKFIVEYMPYADGDYVKVYLYGLSLAARKSDADDSIERLARRLDMDERTVTAAIDYWAEQGLMSRLGDDICYFSPRTARPKIKLLDVDTYKEFNRQAQLYISARQISPNEYHDYYSLMEKLHVEWQAMVLIVKYCVDLKGDDVSCPYILSVARNLAEDGYRTADDVGERLDEFGVYYNDLRATLGAMGKKHVDHEAVQLYKKWKIEYKFGADVILHVAQNIKRGSSIAMLDGKLTQYYKLGFFSADIIDKYEEDRKELYKLASAINKALGVFYENTDPEIATYIKPWLGLGFESKAILAAADYCMKKDMKRLSDLDAVIRDLFGRGLTTEKQVKDSVNYENRFDNKIEKLLKTLNIQGAVKDIHRAYYANWAGKWNMPKALIDYAAELAADKANPFAYMNAVLLAWHNSGITDIKKAKAAAPMVASTQQPAAEGKQTGMIFEKYTEEQLNSLFTPITEDDD